MTTNERLDVLVVGAGPVGTVLAAALAGSGRAVGLVARSAASRVRAARVAPTVALVPFETDADVVLLCVADDDLAATAAALPQRDTLLVVHTSGRHGLAVLGDVSTPTAAAHPVMTFAGGAADLARLPGITFGVTAQGHALDRARDLVAALGGVVEVVPEESRALYHAALSHAANHLVTLICDAADLLRRAGIADAAAVLGPIATAALANVLVDGDRALTGPVVRGDAGTVRAHLQALADSAAHDSYAAMARRTTQRAHQSGRLPDPAADRLLALLTNGG